MYAHNCISANHSTLSLVWPFPVPLFISFGHHPPWIQRLLITDVRGQMFGLGHCTQNEVFLCPLCCNEVSLDDFPKPLCPMYVANGVSLEVFLGPPLTIALCLMRGADCWGCQCG